MSVLVAEMEIRRVTMSIRNWEARQKEVEKPCMCIRKLLIAFLLQSLNNASVDPENFIISFVVFLYSMRRA